ncbi:hypothetical protein EON65_23295, partial [archaeon]
MFRRFIPLLNLNRIRHPGSRQLSGLSKDDRKQLKMLVASGDGESLKERLFDLYKIHLPDAKTNQCKFTLDKVVADLYSHTYNTYTAVATTTTQVDLAKEDALEALAVSKGAHNQLSEKTDYVRCVELMEAFLDQDQVDLAFQLYQQIEAKSLPLDYRALGKLINKAAEHVHVPYLLKLLDKQTHISHHILLCAIEPLVLSGELKKVAQYFDAYLQRTHETNPFHLLHCPWELIQVLQEIVKGRVRRALSQPRLPNTEIAALDSINESLDTYHKHLLDKQFDEQYGDHVEYLLTNISGYRTLPLTFSYPDLAMYMEDYVDFVETGGGEGGDGEKMEDGSLYLPLLRYLPENSRITYQTTLTETPTPPPTSISTS